MVIFLICFTFLLLLSTLIPFVKKEYWVFRIFEYPRLQKLMLTISCIILWSFFISQKKQRASYSSEFVIIECLLPYLSHFSIYSIFKSASFEN